MTPINEELIRNHLSHYLINQPINFYLFNEIDSTNHFLNSIESSQTLSVCCAEQQTAGRGRFGRSWISPFGENIYLSCRKQINCCQSKLSCLSLVIALAVLNSLKPISQNILIKWPNDLLWNHKKLCGILIEIKTKPNNGITTSHTKDIQDIIIGIGLNVNTATHKQSLPDNNPWCSLYELTGTYFDRNSLIAKLLCSLEYYIEQFLHSGFKLFQHTWQQVDYLYGQYIRVSQAQGTLNGYARGITDSGLLRLVSDDGKEHYLLSGETTLKVWQKPLKNQ